MTTRFPCSGESAAHEAGRYDFWTCSCGQQAPADTFKAVPDGFVCERCWEEILEKQSNPENQDAP